MDIGYAIIKGAVQGLAEFLPISSTAHLFFLDTLAEFFNWQASAPPLEKEFFDVMLHFGTLVAVILYFRADLLLTWQQITGKASADTDAHKLLPLKELPKLLAISTTCTVIFVLVLREGSKPLCEAMGWTQVGIGNISEFFYHYPQLVALHLIVTGFLLFFTQRWSDKKLASTGGVGMPVTQHHAIAIGIFQGVAAIFRGISRSGSTISAGLATGLDRVTATRYSFLLSIPTFVLALVYEMKELSFAGVDTHIEWPSLFVGTVVAGIVGYYCVKYFIQFLANNTLYGFAIYCWVMGFIMFAFTSAQWRGSL